MTLQHYLARLMAWCVAPLVGLAVGLGWWQLRHVRDDHAADARRVAQLLAYRVDREFQAREAALLALAASPLLGDDVRLPQLQRQLQDIAQALGGAVLLLDATGRVRLHSGGPPGEPLPPWPRPGGQAAVTRAFETGQPAVGDPSMDPLAEQTLVVVAAPVMQGARVAQVVANAVPVQDLAPLLAALELPASWVLALTDSQDRNVLRRGGDPAEEGVMLRFEVQAQVVPWSAAVLLPQASHARYLWGVATLMLFLLLGATLISVLGGAWATRRLARSVQSLALVGPGSSVPGELDEIRQIRRLLQDTRAQRETALQALRLREAQLSGIFDSASEAIVTVDDTQTIVLANPAAARVFGHPVERLIGRPLELLLPARLRAAHRGHVEDFARSGDPARPMARRRRVLGLHADGHEFPVEAALSQVRADGRTLCTVILHDVSEQQRLADELRASHRDLQRLLAAQTGVQEDVRRRIARELHDELQQVLAAIKLDIGSLLPTLAADPARLPALVTRMDDLATAAITSSRRIVNDLRPQLLEDVGLVAALEMLAAQFMERRPIRVSVDSDTASRDDGEPQDAVALCLYRVAQEALNNIAKHARARRVQMRLSRTPEGGWELRIADDGRGLLAQDRRKAGTFGLRGMAERVRALGGDLRVDGEGGPGVVVTARVGPGAAPEPEADAAVEPERR